MEMQQSSSAVLAEKHLYGWQVVMTEAKAIVRLLMNFETDAQAYLQRLNHNREPRLQVDVGSITDTAEKLRNVIKANGYDLTKEAGRHVFANDLMWRVREAQQTGVMHMRELARMHPWYFAIVPFLLLGNSLDSYEDEQKYREFYDDKPAH